MKNNHVKKVILCVFLFNMFSFNTMANSNYKTAIFAGGCFWCMEVPFDKLDGVVSTVSGYIGGHVENPTYNQVSSGKSGHIEALEITYNPQKISYKELLHTYWRNIDPFDLEGQFCDRGEQYQAIIFTKDDTQKKLSNSSKVEISKKLNHDIKIKIVTASKFYPAEEYHQNYYQKNPIRYKYYRHACGRDKRLKEIWKD